MDTGTARLLHLAEAMDNFKELGKPHGIDKFNIANFSVGHQPVRWDLRAICRDSFQRA